ncbi:MAG: hypothetical protein PUK40_00390 [Actinomycetaceae bacterium]|nr:MSCRAMM family adhesin SdrC [Arcanobacterium sp.]MDD7504398.1 hypothetical protein [Actinomycetaceae bacterium]MDY6143586.1 hypothetical protein [Arcanobacterium sp.]
MPESITLDSLDPQTRAHLRSLNAENAERVGRHLAYAGEMLDIDPEVAYAHAKAAYASAARIDIVREAVGIAAYITGRYSEALSELRTYRRMSDDYSHVAIEADAERGLGRSEKALRFIEGIPLNKLDPEAKVELAIVTSGARADVGNSEGGLSVLEKIKVDNLKPELAARVELVIADRYDELGRADEAQAIRLKWAPVYDDADAGDMLVDLADVLDDEASEEITEATDGDALAAVHADDDAHEHDELSLDGEPDADDFAEADDSDDLVRETASDDSDDASPVVVDDHEFEDEFDDEFEDDFGGDFEDESDGLDSAEHIVSDTDAPVQDTLWDSLDDSGSDWDSESDR